MSSHGEQPRVKGPQKSSIQEKVATFYYGLGLFCSTYPVYVLVLVFLVVLACWSPLVNLQFPGNSPQREWTSVGNSSGVGGGGPFCYVQQVVLRAAVLPWEPELTLADAFRAPLYESFKLLEIVRNYQDKKSLKTLGHYCLHIEALKKSKLDYNNVLPQYSCLVLSPANLWHQDVQKFAEDSSILTTIFNHHSLQKGKTSIAEMLFGMHLFDTGIKRYPLRNRQRIIQYAVTLFLKEYDEEFVNGLADKLKSAYPLFQNASSGIEKVQLNDTILIKYPGEIHFWEQMPLIVSFFMLFLYYYFSIRKIEMIKSKLGMAFTATITVFSSLLMTLGICFFFGLTLSLQGGKSIYPYLAILVGLENVLVLTKSVVSTPLHLDVKIRNAQGLSKEGWGITKNLLLEITIFTIGLFTFVPFIQEFCIFAIVGLLTDFFLQMSFFSTILGIDIRRMENSAEKTQQSFRTGLYQNQALYDKSSFKPKGMNRSKSHPRLNNFPAKIAQSQDKKIPKRLILVNIWARTRFFQRSFMILMMIWICIIAYNSDVINQYIINNVLEDRLDAQNDSNLGSNYSIKLFPRLNTSDSYMNVNYVTYNPLSMEYRRNQSHDLDKLKHSEFAPWLKLSSRHWPSIFKKYNMSLSGQVVAVLPNIKLSHVITPEQAILMRHPEEKYGDRFQWQALAAALDPIDFSDAEGASAVPQSEQPFYPTSPMEIILTTILCIISIVVLAYLIVVLYRCVCSRNYAEWRASWHKEKNEEIPEEQVLLEAVPVVLKGHQQEIECIATDGATLVSACLGGSLKIWDNITGEMITLIDRKQYFSPKGSFQLDPDCDDLSDYESSSPPSRDEYFPKILNRINTDFSNVNGLGGSSDIKYDFMKSYKHFYLKSDFDIRHRGSFNEGRKSKWKVEKGRIDGESNKSFDSNASLSRDLSDCGSLSPVWCVDYVDNLIVVGCADGRLEFWEGTTGKLKCIFEDGSESGISHVRMVGSKVVAARLCGTLEFFQLQTLNQGRPIDWNFTCAYRRTHIRTGSVGSIDREFSNQTDNNEDFICMKITSVKAHQQPINCLDSEGGRVLTGSQDHTLKVFRLEDGSLIYTLHGHCGPITCLFIDRVSPATAGSGSQDGMLCVWDLMTGACMYNIEAHNGSIISLTYSASYIISLGVDERLCVWERFQGHLLNTINVPPAFSNHIVMLAPHLVVTARSGGLIIWDVRSGECVRTIGLGRAPYVFINQLILLRDAVVCDYGKQLRIVRFPLITHKFD